MFLAGLFITLPYSCQLFSVRNHWKSWSQTTLSVIVTRPVLNSADEKFESFVLFYW